MILKYFLYNLNSFFISCDITNVKYIIIKILFSKMVIYQNKMLVLTNCINVLSSSFTSMQSFLNIFLISVKELYTISIEARRSTLIDWLIFQGGQL